MPPPVANGTLKRQKSGATASSCPSGFRKRAGSGAACQRAPGRAIPPQDAAVAAATIGRPGPARAPMARCGHPARLGLIKLEPV